MNILIDSVFCLCRKDPKKTSTRIKANIPRHTIPQNRKDIRDITGKRKLTVTTAVMARRLATRVNSRTTNINNKFIRNKHNQVCQFTTHSQFRTRYSLCRTGLKTVVRSLFCLTWHKGNLYAFPRLRSGTNIIHWWKFLQHLKYMKYLTESQHRLFIDISKHSEIFLTTRTVDTKNLANFTRNSQIECFVPEYN